MNYSSRARLAVAALVAGLAVAAPASAQVAPAQLAVSSFPAAYRVLPAPPMKLAAALKRSSRKPVIIGALVGAAAGTVLTFASSDCRTGYSMCGLALPLYAGGGALIGGLAGYVWSLRR